MRIPVEDMTFIIRAAPGPGERTLPASEGVLRELVRRAGGDPRVQVSVVREQPFAAAVKRTFQIGLDARRPWVVGMDADVLLLPDALERLGGLCAATDGATFTVAALMLCKFYGGFCFRGIHCYPRCYLERALRLFDFCGAKNYLKPETAVIKAMEREGFHPVAPPVPIGVHDYEQWLRHIYPKMRMRGRREVADEANGGCFAAQMAIVQARPDDPDFFVAAWGLQDGRTDALAAANDPATPASAHYPWDGDYPELDRRLRERSMSEKPRWTADLNSALRFAEATIAAHDYASDRRTPRWIRDRLGFEHGTSHALVRIGVDPAPVRTLPIHAGSMGEVA